MSKDPCRVTYSRRTCEPFCLGIEGAKCELDSWHDGKHVTRIVAEHGDTPDQDKLKTFEFTVTKGEAR